MNEGYYGLISGLGCKEPIYKIYFYQVARFIFESNRKLISFEKAIIEQKGTIHT